MSRYHFIVNHATGEVHSQSVRFSGKLRLLAHNEERKLYVVHIAGGTGYVDRQVGYQYSEAETVVLEAVEVKAWGSSNSEQRISVANYRGIMSWRSRRKKATA